MSVRPGISKYVRRLEAHSLTVRVPALSIMYVIPLVLLSPGIRDIELARPERHCTDIKTCRRNPAFGRSQGQSMHQPSVRHSSLAPRCTIWTFSYSHAAGPNAPYSRVRI
jgi:hypothetical protein